MTKEELAMWARYRDKHEREAYRMAGGPYTRRRLACHQHPTLGKWERTHVICKDMTADAIYGLVRWLPPECVSPTRYKLRSHRPDVRLSTIAQAAERSRVYARLSMSAWEDIEPLLDRPAEDIETLARMNALRRLVRCG